MCIRPSEPIPERLRNIVDFTRRYLPRMEALARCEDPKNCRDPATETMTFVDGHQSAFVSHGFCAKSEANSPFDRECLYGHAETFRSGLTTAATDPISCGYPPNEFRPYASRARWIRTANDSYLTAMTYPEGLPIILQPSDLHDAIWGFWPRCTGSRASNGGGSCRGSWPCGSACRARGARIDLPSNRCPQRTIANTQSLRTAGSGIRALSSHKSARSRRKQNASSRIRVRAS